METLKAIAQRKSTRGFRAEQIPADVVEKILIAGSMAPVAWEEYHTLHLTVIQNAEILKEITAAAQKTGDPDTDPLYGAPTLVVVSASYEQCGPYVEYANVGCIMENMLLAATDLGVDNVYIWGAFMLDETLCRKLGIPEGFRPVSSAALGYAADVVQTVKPDEIALSVNWVK